MTLSQGWVKVQVSHRYRKMTGFLKDQHNDHDEIQDSLQELEFSQSIFDNENDPIKVTRKT